MQFKTLALASLVLATSLPNAAMAHQSRASRHRQETKNDWRNIATASGVVAALGLLKNDGTLTFVGTAGALYGAWRYEQDRKSQNKLDRARAAYFSRDYFVRDGVRYDRRTVNKNGQRYFQFVRHDNGLHKGWTKGKGNKHGGHDRDDD